MEREKIVSELTVIMAGLLKLDVDQLKLIVSENAILRDELGIDSVESLDFISAVEKQYGIEILDEELIGVNTVKQIVDIVIKRAAS